MLSKESPDKNLVIRNMCSSVPFAELSKSKALYVKLNVYFCNKRVTCVGL